MGVTPVLDGDAWRRRDAESSLRITQLSDRLCGSETRRSLCVVAVRQVLIPAQSLLWLAPLELTTQSGLPTHAGLLEMS